MLDWMNWTQPVAIFFAVIAAILVVMTVSEILVPCTERKGFLPIATTESADATRSWAGSHGVY